MSENQKQSVNTAALIIVSALLAGTVTLLGFTARAVYDLNAQVASLRTTTSSQSDRLDRIEQHGSPIIQGISARLDNLTAGQARIEKALEEHMKQISKP